MIVAFTCDRLLGCFRVGARVAVSAWAFERVVVLLDRRWRVGEGGVYSMIQRTSD